jgi:ferredoxin-nitrite reductase
MRGVQSAPRAELLTGLQTVGLAAIEPQMDRLRNIMASPTAGIDRGEILDVSPWVRELDAYLQSHRELAGLPAKFSIGLDGGGMVGIGTRSPVAWEHRYNEIQLSAVERDGDNYFHLALGGDSSAPMVGERVLVDTGLLIELEGCTAAVAALAEVYLDYVNTHPQESKPRRMKHLLADWGLAGYLDRVNQKLSTSVRAGFVLNLSCNPNTKSPDPPLQLPSPLSPSACYQHLGIHPQRQENLYYIGVSLPLGQLTIEQLLGLSEIATNFGSSQIRLTPWQTILLPDLPQEKVDKVLQELEGLGLSLPKNPVATAIVACAGKPGCVKAATDTQAHALALADDLDRHLHLDRPVNIHFTGCPKSCAQSSPAEITLLGTTIDRDGHTIEGYHIYRSDGSELTDIPVEEIGNTIAQMIINN